ncbi:hypothetical protein ACFL46_06360, partial [Candidatus Neomarinimicrobiota bacterium]
IEKAIDRVYGSFLFNRVLYKIVPNNDAYDLILRTVESNVDFFKYGFHYDTDLKTTLLLNTTLFNKLGMGSRLHADLLLGENYGVELSYYNPLTRVIGVGANIDFKLTKFDIPFYGEKSRSLISVLGFSRYSGDFSILTNFSSMFSFGIGLTTEHFNYNPKIGGDNIPEIQNDNYLSRHGFLIIDTFDKTIFPSKGVQFELRSKIITDQFLNGNKSKQQVINKLTMKFHWIIPLSEKTILSNRVYAGHIKGDNVPLLHNHFLGGTMKRIFNTFPFNGLKFMEIFNKNIFTYQLKVRNEIWSNHFLSVEFDAGYTAPNFDELISFSGQKYGYGMSYSLNTPLGQMEFHLSMDNENKEVIPFISVGYLF